MRQLGVATLVGVIVGTVAVQLHATEVSGGEETASGWALGWHVLLVAIAVGLGGIRLVTPRQTAVLALLAASVVAVVHIYADVRLPGYEVGAAIVGTDVSDDVHIAPQRCRRVHFIGVRGSGETERDGDGYGTVVQEFRRALIDELGSSHLDSTPIDYPSAGVGTLAVNADRFFSSFEAGANELTNEIRQSLNDCPTRRLVLAGHSQGAAVVHMSITALSPDERNAVALAVLFSDPAREVGDTVNRGYLDGPDGSFVEAAGARLPGMPSSLNAQSWCFEGDLVCSWNWNPVTIWSFRSNSTQLHSEPYTAIADDLAVQLAPTLLP